MLRLRKQLSDQAAQVDSSLKDAQSKPADEVRAAVASIRTAFAGDLTKLDEAHVHLRTVSGAAPGPAAAQTVAQKNAADVNGAAIALREKVAGLASSVRDQKGP